MAVNMDEDVSLASGDITDLKVLPNLGGLSRLTTDPVSQNTEAAAAAQEEDDVLGDLQILPNLKGLIRLETDPAQKTTLTPNKDSDLSSFEVPNLSQLYRLQTDPAAVETKTDAHESTTIDLELIPIQKMYNTPKVMKLLQNGIDSDFIDWNIFDLYEITSRYTLCICCKYLFNKLDLFSKLNIAESKLLSFVHKIESGYLDNNSYHNSLHATDVMLNAYHYLIKSGLIHNDLDVMIVLIAAICHDYKHPGLQMQFLIEINDPITIQYKTLEQMHIAETFQILEQNAFNFMINMDEKKVKYVKQCVKEMILATDMKMHAKHVKKLEELKQDKMEKRDIMCIGLHAADTGSVCKSYSLFEQWGKRIFEEWFAEGDKQKAKGMKVTQYCDRQRDSERINERHSEFLTSLMMPFYQKWSIVFHDKQQFGAWYKQLCDNRDKLNTDGITM